VGAESLVPQRPSSILPTEDLSAYVYVLVDEAISTGTVAIAPRPGPAPACIDAELLAIMLVRHLLGRRCEARFLAEAARDWAHLFPVLPHQSQANRRIRWLWRASEQLRAMLAARLPADDCHERGAHTFWGLLTHTAVTLAAHTLMGVCLAAA
jgi:hypothetical protein